MYGVKVRTVWLWEDKGIIPPPVVRQGAYVRWLLSTIQAAIKSAEHAERTELTT